MSNYITKTDYITQREKEVIGRLSYEKKDIVTRKQFDAYFYKYPKNVRSKLIFRLKKKGILKKIKNGLYIYSPIEAGPGGRNISEYRIPELLFPGGEYYMGYSPMYNYYRFTDQIYQVVYLLNTKLQRTIDAGGLRFNLLKISKSRMYGITEADFTGAKVRVSDRERTLVDLLYYSAPAGGLKKAYKIMTDEIISGRAKLKKFIAYLEIFPSAYVRKRAGYMLEKAGIKTGSLVKTINSYSLMTLYEGRSRKGEIDKKWGVIINDSQG
jgi:predicted transcriptional regulator of viral defense system